MSRSKKLWIGIAVLVILSPLGLILPAWLGAGTAWGEWSAEELQQLTGHMPAGMQRLGDMWRAPVPDYGSAGTVATKAGGANVAYLLSAAAGVLIVTALAYGFGRLLARREERADDT